MFSEKQFTYFDKNIPALLCNDCLQCDFTPTLYSLLPLCIKCPTATTERATVSLSNHNIPDCRIYVDIIQDTSKTINNAKQSVLGVYLNKALVTAEYCLELYLRLDLRESGLGSTE